METSALFWLWVILQVTRNPTSINTSSLSGLYRQRVCLRNTVLFQAADYRVLGSVFLGIAGAEEGQQETLVGTGFSVLASQTAQGFGFS